MHVGCEHNPLLGRVATALFHDCTKLTWILYLTVDDVDSWTSMCMACEDR